MALACNRVHLKVFALNLLSLSFEMYLSKFEVTIKGSFGGRGTFGLMAAFVIGSTLAVIGHTS